jgi:hypothetical protein
VRRLIFNTICFILFKDGIRIHGLRCKSSGRIVDSIKFKRALLWIIKPQIKEREEKQ